MNRRLSLFVSLGLAAATAAWAADPSPSPSPQPFQNEFDAADTNHDGKLSPEEAKRGGFFNAKSFKSADYDGDGTVTLFELGKAVAKDTQDLLDEHGQHDANGDGRVDKTEAKAGSRLATVFDRADANQDSQVDQQEIRNWAARTYYSEDADYPIVPNIINEKF